MQIDCHVEGSFAQEIARLQVADFSVLRLLIESKGHAFGPLLLHLLQIRPVICRLELELIQGEVSIRSVHLAKQSSLGSLCFEIIHSYPKFLAAGRHGTVPTRLPLPTAC